MTFAEMAASAFGLQETDNETLAAVALAMQVGYVAALRSLSVRVGGVEQIYIGSKPRLLSEVVEKVIARAGPL